MISRRIYDIRAETWSFDRLPRAGVAYRLCKIASVSTKRALIAQNLRYFDVDDADLFFGREALTAKLAGYLHNASSPVTMVEGWGGGRFLAIVGASGSGKSSLVRAGLVPALKRGEPLADGTLPPAGSDRWQTLIITPTANPLERLALSLTSDLVTVGQTEQIQRELKTSAHSLPLYVRKYLDRLNKDRL